MNIYFQFPVEKSCNQINSETMANGYQVSKNVTWNLESLLGKVLFPPSLPPLLPLPFFFSCLPFVEKSLFFKNYPQWTTFSLIKAFFFFLPVVLFLFLKKQSIFAKMYPWNESEIIITHHSYLSFYFYFPSTSTSVNSFPHV